MQIINNELFNTCCLSALLLPDPWQTFPMAHIKGRVDVISSLLKHAGGGLVPDCGQQFRYLGFIAIGTKKYNYTQVIGNQKKVMSV